MRNLEQYLRDAAKAGAIEFKIRADAEGPVVSFYIYPLGKNGSTLDFQVQDNKLVTLHDTDSAPLPTAEA